jgi:hypothetical protein
VRAATLIAIALCGGMLTSCGGDSTARKPPPGSTENPLAARTDPTTRTSEDPSPEEGARSRASEAGATSKPAARTSASAPASRKPTADSSVVTRPAIPGRKLPTVVRPSARRPCTLVTKAQAEAIVGRPLLEPIQAPQGPTCIYRDRADRSYITVGVQSTTLAELGPQLRRRPAVAVSGRTAYCIRLVTPTLYVGLPGRRVLSVAAPCGVARRFAAAALATLRT